jgi:rhomboid protease GluP
MYMLRQAPISAALGGILLLAYGAGALRAGAWWDIAADALLPIGAGFAPALAAGEWWRVVSAAFLHGGFLHLLVNLVVLADIAPIVEAAPRFDAGSDRSRHSRSCRTLCLPGIFLASAACGFVASAWWNPQAVSVGASGGILGLYGYWLVGAWHRSGRDPAALAWRRRIALAAGYLGAAVLAGVLIPGIDNAAHFAGLASGALLGRLVAAGHAGAGAGLLAALVLSGLAAMPERWAIPFQEREEFTRRYQAFAERDRAANAAIAELLSDIRNGRDLGDVTEDYRQGVIGPLQDNLAVWSARSAPWVTPAIDAEQARWRRYATLRLAAAQALHAALQTGDSQAQAAALASFEQSMRAARDIAESTEGDSHDLSR